MVCPVIVYAVSLHNASETQTQQRSQGRVQRFRGEAGRDTAREKTPYRATQSAGAGRIFAGCPWGQAALLAGMVQPCRTYGGSGYNSLSERDGAAPWSFPKKGNKGKVPARGRARAHAREAGTAYTTPRQTTTARATIREDTPRNDSPRQSAAAYKKKSGARQPRRVSPRLSSVQLFPERAGSSLQTSSAIS